MTTGEIVALLDATNDDRAQEFAIVLCAEACAHLTDDQRTTECRRARLLWAAGNVADCVQARAIVAAREAADNLRQPSAHHAAMSATRYTVRSAASDAAEAVSWTLQYPGEWSLSRCDSERERVRALAYEALASPLRSLYSDPREITAAVARPRWSAAVFVARRALRLIGGAS